MAGAGRAIAMTCFLLLWSSLRPGFAAPRPPRCAKVPAEVAAARKAVPGSQHGIVAQELWRNKANLTKMMFLAVAECFCSACEKQFVGELAQFCLIAQNQAEFWPRMQKILLVLLLLPVLRKAYGSISALTSQSIKLSIQQRMFPSVLASDFTEGAATSLLNPELDELMNVLHNSVRGVVGTVFYSIFLALLVRRSSPHFRRIFTILMCVLIFGVVTSLCIQRKVEPAAAKATQAKRDLTDGIMAELRVAEETRAYGATKQRRDRLSQVMKTGLVRNVDLENLRQQWQMFDGWRQNSNFVAAYYLLGRPVMRGEMPFAVYHATFGLSINLATSLRTVLESAGDISACNKTIQTINEMQKYEGQPTSTSKQCASSAGCRLVISDLTLQLKNDAVLLKDVSFSTEQGQLIAIVGKSGSGKSTLLKAIAGEVSCTGRVERPGSVTLMRQNPPLLPDTLWQNVAMHGQLSDEQIRKCLTQAAASDLGERLNDTLSEKQEEGKWTPSGGERQRIGLARAVCRQPDILLLDEPTSALDHAAEKQIFKMLKELKKQCIVLMVTHRPTLAEQADEIIVMEDGKLVEQGRPASLKGKGTKYSKLLEGVRF